MAAPSSLAYLLIFSTLIFTNLIATSSGARPAAVGKSDTTFLKTSCGATSYPNLCFSSLSSRVSAIRSDPKILAHEALVVSLETARSTSATMVQLAQGHGLQPREVGAMRDCVEQLSDSVDQLRRSLAEMNQMRGGSNFDLTMNDIQTWVSAALTDDDTCTDGFPAGKGNLKIAVRGKILNVAHLTSNALALINTYASHHG